MNTSSSNFKAMSFDKLSKLRDEVDAILKAKVAEERRTVQSRLNELDRLAVNGARAKGAGRGSRGAVAPKYRNPENPAETWAGRGLKPRWLAARSSPARSLKISASMLQEKVYAPDVGKRQNAKVPTGWRLAGAR